MNDVTARPNSVPWPPMPMEAIREIVGFGEGLVGRLLMVDALLMRFETLRDMRDPQKPLNGDAPVITERASLGRVLLDADSELSASQGKADMSLIAGNVCK
jgi:hypothetical protein